MGKPEDIQEVIHADREKKIRRAMDKAWADWWKDRLKYGQWNRTRAGMVFERLMVHLREEFRNDSGAIFHFKNETFKLSLDRKLLIRFKKANGKGLGANIPTQEVMDFCKAQAQLEIPGLPPPLQKLEITYRLNATQSAIAEITVQERDEDVRIWAYALDGREQTKVVGLPKRGVAQPSSADDLVAPRKSGRKEKSKDDDDKKE
ncbi:MAG: hypothetical protein WCD70_10495 [Alphaproteobacteria bacterium]